MWKADYVEGEEMYVRMYIETLVDSPSTKLSWQNTDRHLIHLEKSDGGLFNLLAPSLSVMRRLPHDATDSMCFIPSGGVYELKWGHLGAPLVEENRFPPYDGEHSFNESTHSMVGLLPGKYRGYFDLGVTSNWFEFEVQRATEQDDDNRLLFARYNSLRDTTNRKIFAWRALKHFEGLSKDTPMRCEGLIDGLVFLGPGSHKKKETQPQMFSVEDSTNLISVLRTIADDCPCHTRRSTASIYGALTNLMQQNRPG